jgi:crossover junction endodeoxyribonuclease RusA
MINRATRGNTGNDINGISAHFFVAGKPVPQGSLKFINGHAIHVRAQDLALWRADIANSARATGISKAEGSVEITLTFVMLKPKSVKRTEPFVRPDLDKLIRAVLDGLTDVAYLDDCQVTKVTATKTYGENQGVWIRITDKEKLNSILADAERIIDVNTN